ncbi:MAG TPA: YchJ family protein, partial [Methylophilaceae bacterium]|nr:YchJ family protein [Methylophilaceae bacterium]
GLCPCGSATAYTACCQPWHLGRPAPTAEALMRSRYTAYVLNLEDYLLRTWHADTRPVSLDFDQGVPTRWLGLEILRCASTGENTAIVEFVARYKVNGKAGKLHELSRFIKMGQNWYYVDGEY